MEKRSDGKQVGKSLLDAQGRILITYTETENTEGAEGINQISMYLNTQAGIPIAKAMADMK